MKVIEQLVRHLSQIGTLRDDEVAWLRDQGLLPPIEGYDHEHEYEHPLSREVDDSWEYDYWYKERISPEPRERKRRGSRRTSQQRSDLRQLKKTLSMKLALWCQQDGNPVVQSLCDFALRLAPPAMQVELTDWRSASLAICRTSAEQLTASIPSGALRMVIDMLLIDPAASMLEDIVTHETRRINQRIAVMQTKALLAPWLDAQRHIGRCLAQTSLQSTGLLKLHSLHESSSEYVDQFVWLMVIASLLKRGHHSLEELGARIIPDECVCLVRRRFLPPNHQLTASELRMISTVIESTDLSMDHTRKLVGHPEIHLLWDPIPKEIHGPLQRFLGL